MKVTVGDKDTNVHKTTYQSNYCYLKKPVPTAFRVAVSSSNTIKMLIYRGEMEIPVSEYGKAKRLSQYVGLFGTHSTNHTSSF
jgi:hypothetical protein